MRRLYLQIYLTIIASLFLVVLGAGALWRFAPYATPADHAFEIAGELVAALLPPAGEAAAVQQRAIDQLHERLGVDLALFDTQRRPIAAAGRPLPPPRPDREWGGWLRGRGGPMWAVRLPDDRWIVTRVPPGHRRPVLGFIGFIGVALAVAVCAYPLVRWLTGRLERLQSGVELLGAGELSTRVKVEGKDEVARLAASFNRAAGRIEELLAANKQLLAHTSHELRTPLTRIRLGVELIKATANPGRTTELERDIAELDGLIEQILLSSRLDAVTAVDTPEDVDLLAVAAEEGARYERCVVSGHPVTVLGDRTLLRRMVRNLIDNAEQHGLPPVEVEVRRVGTQAVLVARDHGPGVAADERERIFAPFYRAPGGAARGTGLGLTLVRQIARRHGGDAVWAGTADRASSIRVTIPLKARAGPGVGGALGS